MSQIEITTNPISSSPETGLEREAGDQYTKPQFLSYDTDLKRVEEKIVEKLGSDAPILTEVSEYLLHLGGKRIRPLLVLTAARLFGTEEPTEEIISVAAGIELIHMATLLHDDIIDQSPTRRRKTSAYRYFGLTPTLLTGDFLLVRAFGLCAQLDKFVIQNTEAACVELTEGEILEGTIDVQSPTTLPQYTNIIDKKTASLFALSASVGAHLAKAGKYTDNLTKFGRYAGTAFQMVDDILDITADEDLLGKPVGTDLRQKTPSLINVLWFSSGDAAAREFFSLEQPQVEDCEKAVERILKTEVITQSREIAKEYAERSIKELELIDESVIDVQIKQQLIALVNYTLYRCL